MITLLFLVREAEDMTPWDKAITAAHTSRVATTVAEFTAALERNDCDLVFVAASFALEGTPSPVEVATKTTPHVPVILVATPSEEATAAHAVETGSVADAVSASSPELLNVAILRVFRERDLRRRLEATDNQLHATEERCGQAEATARQLNATWEQRVGERTASLEAAMKELEAFSYSVSHDLRAPLRGIDGFARALKEDCGASLGPEGLRLLETIRGETRRMGQLIDDLLAFSRAGRQQIDRSETDMTELARSAYQNILEALPSAGPTFELGALPVAEGDRSMLRQVFANLLGNAVKFSSKQPNPKVEVAGWTEGAMHVYRVKDNGVGFDPRYTHKLFSVFQRLHSQEDFEGTGVGLALVQRIVQRHGGKVWAEAKPKEGASFFFALPAAAGAD